MDSMPDTLDYQRLTRTTSGPRIASYKNLFTDHTDQEIYGIYLWNKALCGAIYPTLQAAEIALRNAIDGAAREMYGDYWYQHIPHFQRKDQNGNLVNDDNYKDFKAQFKRSKGAVVKALGGAAAIPVGQQPCFDKVVSETNFVTWEYVLHRCFFRVGDKNFLWPTKTKKAFANWPDQSAKKTHTVIYDLVVEIRPFRNRLSHHEPLWKAADVSTEEDAIAFISKKIAAIEQLLHIICDEKVRLLEQQGMIRKARGLATKEALDRFRHRAESYRFSLKHKRRARHFLFEAHDRDVATLFEYGGRLFSIERA